MNIFSNILISMRPKQWIKNLFVFAALIFVKQFTDFDKILLAAEAFFIFCSASSAVYLMNDIVDLPKDREHPLKKIRPLAAGKIKPWLAALSAFIFGLFAVIWSFYLGAYFGLLICAYIILNILYSFYLKEMIILDVFIIAIGFVIRVVAGAVVIGVPFSSWLILCTFFLTLFLAINKRKSELLFNVNNGGRTVLKDYSAAFLNEMGIVALSATIISYTFYTFSSEHSKLLMITVPIVLYGLFYYLFVMSQKKEGDNGPTDVFMKERNLQLTVLVWITVSAIILFLGS